MNKQLSRLLTVIMLSSYITTTQAIHPINRGLIVLAATAAVGITARLGVKKYYEHKMKNPDYLEECLQEDQDYCAKGVKRLTKALENATARNEKYQAFKSDDTTFKKHLEAWATDGANFFGTCCGAATAIIATAVAVAP
jgi:hypothetical protein